MHAVRYRNGPLQRSPSLFYDMKTLANAALPGSKSQATEATKNAKAAGGIPPGFVAPAAVAPPAQAPGASSSAAGNVAPGVGGGAAGPGAGAPGAAAVGGAPHLGAGIAAALGAGAAAPGADAPPPPAGQHTMAEIFAAVAGGQAPGPGGGKGGGKGAGGAGVGVQLRVHRALLLQLDARLRRREALATTMLGPEDFPPAVASLDALERYLGVAKAQPYTHNLGASDVHLALAFMGNCFEQRLWTQDESIISRAVALYVVVTEAFKCSPDLNSDWIPTFQVAALPAYGTKRAQTLMSWELIGSVNLMAGADLARAVALIRLHEAGTPQDLSLLTAATCIFQDGEVVPATSTRRVCALNRVLMVIASALGATKTHGSGPRGRAARAVLQLGKGKGKGKGKDLNDLAEMMWDDA